MSDNNHVPLWVSIPIIIACLGVFGLLWRHGNNDCKNRFGQDYGYRFEYYNPGRCVNPNGEVKFR